MIRQMQPDGILRGQRARRLLPRPASTSTSPASVATPGPTTSRTRTASAGSRRTSTRRTTSGRTASFDRRHRLGMYAMFNPKSVYNIAAGIFANTGRPWTITTGTDAYGDSFFNTRPDGVARNTETMPSYVDLDLRWGHDFAITSNKDEDAPRLGLFGWSIQPAQPPEPIEHRHRGHIADLWRCHRRWAAAARFSWACASSSRAVLRRWENRCNRRNVSHLTELFPCSARRIPLRGSP